jgi:hypothetical protein
VVTSDGWLSLEDEYEWASARRFMRDQAGMRVACVRSWKPLGPVETPGHRARQLGHRHTPTVNQELFSGSAAAPGQSSARESSGLGASLCRMGPSITAIYLSDGDVVR